MVRHKLPSIKIISLVCLFAIICSGKFSVLAAEISRASDIALPIETYLAGENQCTHPSVLTFDEEWNGYKYWMAYTPYPYADGEEENPSIAVSDDMINWTTPPNLANPIVDNEDTGCAELKDPHLLYNDKTDCMELWFLGRLSSNLGGDDNTLVLFRTITEDGINWSDYEVMYEFTDGINGVSPSIIWTGKKYLFYAIVCNEQFPDGKLMYKESIDGKFSDEIKYIDTDFINIWHGSMQYINGQFEFVYVGREEYDQYILYSTSEDGINFEPPTKIIKNYDWNRLYRPCLAYTNNTYYLYYGVISDDNRWMISCSYGENLQNLSQLSESLLTNDSDIYIKPISTKIRINLIVSSIFETFNQSVFLVGLIFAVVSSIILKLILGKRKDLHRILFIVIILILILINMTTLLIFNYSFISIIKSIVTNIIISLVEFCVFKSIFNMRVSK